MRNMLKADLYRIFRSFGFYATIAVLLGLVIYQVSVYGNGAIGVHITSIDSQNITTGDYQSATRADGNTEIAEYPQQAVIKMTGKSAPFMFADASDILIYFLLPLIVIIAASDFSCGTVKNTLAAGMSRKKYFFVKLVLCVGACLLLVILNLAATIIAATIKNGFGGSFDLLYISELAGVFLPQLYLLLAYACIGLFISVAFKRTAALTTIYLLFGVLPFLARNSLGNNFERLANYYDLALNIKLFAYIDGVHPPNLRLSLILGGIYIIACTAGGLALFRKCEIK